MYDPGQSTLTQVIVDEAAHPRTDQVAVTTKTMPNDRFLFYSIDENRRNAMLNRPIDYSNDGSDANAPVRRKKRLSFETDLLSVVAGLLAEE